MLVSWPMHVRQYRASSFSDPLLKAVDVQGGRRHSATESSMLGANYAQELAMTFAASRGQMLQGGYSQRGSLRRIDTPLGPLIRDVTPPESRASSLSHTEFLDRSRRSLSEHAGYG